MFTPNRGRYLSISPARRMVSEILHHAKQVPSLPTARMCDLDALREARLRAGPNPPSWMAIMLRAYGIVSREYPELRRAWLPYPWPRLYEHPTSQAGVLVERMWQGETIIVGGLIRAPEEKSLREIDSELSRFQTADIWEIGFFRQFLRVGALPLPLRRLTFWRALHVSGSSRAKHLGTFTISSLGNLGANQVHPLTPLTSYFTFGPIERERFTELRIIYDHRVMDDRTVARILARLESILTDQIKHELEESALLQKSKTC